MAGLCTASVSPSNCAHRTLTIQWDGQGYTLEHLDVDQPLTAEERLQYLGLAVRLLKSKGVSLAEFVNRVLVGEEATNVKSHSLIGAGSAVTKTNIGTAYVNILPGLTGQRSLVDFTGCTQFRLVLSVNLVGLGQFGARLVRDSDSAVLFEQANLGAAGERELDTDWVALPVQASGQTLVRLQANSQTAADDPIFRGCVLLVR